MIIRQATTHDAPYIKKLLSQLGYPDLEIDEVIIKIEHYSSENYHLLVAEIDVQVIGFISMHWFHIFHSIGKIGRISAFCIDESFRSKQIGQQLLLAAETFLTQKGCSKIEVTSNIKRIRSHEFYLNTGYVEDSKRFTKYPELPSS